MTTLPALSSGNTTRRSGAHGVMSMRAVLRRARGRSVLMYLASRP